MALSEARPESFFAAEKDLRDWIPFLRLLFFFLAVLGKIERLETGKTEGWESWIPACNDSDEDFELKAQNIRCHSQRCVNCTLMLSSKFGSKGYWGWSQHSAVLQIRPVLSSHWQVSEGNFRERILQVFRPLIWVWSRKAWPAVTTLAFIFNRYARKRSVARKATPMCTSAKQKRSRRCGYRFFWWSHRGLKGL